MGVNYYNHWTKSWDNTAECFEASKRTVKISTWLVTWWSNPWFRRHLSSMSNGQLTCHKISDQVVLGSPPVAHDKVPNLGSNLGAGIVFWTSLGIQKAPSVGMKRNRKRRFTTFLVVDIGTSWSRALDLNVSNLCCLWKEAGLSQTTCMTVLLLQLGSTLLKIRRFQVFCWLLVFWSHSFFPSIPSQKSHRPSVGVFSPPPKKTKDVARHPEFVVCLWEKVGFRRKKWFGSDVCLLTKIPSIP